MKFVNIILLFFVFIIGCGEKGMSTGDIIIEPSQVVEGGLYYSQSKDEQYCVSKILVIDDVAFHVRMYANKFKAPPTKVLASELTLGGIDSPDGFGIGHAPMAKEGFLLESTYFIRQELVSEEELEGYKYYLEAMQGQ